MIHRLEQREPHVVVLLEDHAHGHFDVNVLGVAAHDVRREPDARVLLDLDRLLYSLPSWLL